MTARAWTTREAGPGDWDRIRGLYRDVWGYGRPRGYEEWRYFSNPHGACPTTIAVDADRVVGFYTLWPVMLRIGDEAVLGAQSMDTMTHPDYQGQGMFTTLAGACYELAAAKGFEVLYGFPNPLSYPGFVRRLEWRHVGDMMHWIRLVRPSRHPAVPAAVGPLADLAAFCLPGGGARGADVEIGPPETAQLEALVGSVRAADPAGVCRVDRGAAWLRWRYAPEAENDYEWVSAYRGGELIAAGAWGMRSAAWGDAADARAHLVELIGTDRRGLRAVASAILGRARRGGALLAETISGVPSVAPVLRRLGYYRHRRAPFIVKSLTGRRLAADVFDIGSWRLFGGDVDTF